jgi:hypothetical protein
MAPVRPFVGSRINVGVWLDRRCEVERNRLWIMRMDWSNVKFVINLGKQRQEEECNKSSFEKL